MTAASKLQMCIFEGEVVADERNLVLLDGRVDDGKGVGAGGALEVFELVDGDGNAGRGAEHGGVAVGACLGEGGRLAGRTRSRAAARAIRFIDIRRIRLSFVFYLSDVAGQGVAGPTLGRTRSFCRISASAGGCGTLIGEHEECSTGNFIKDEGMAERCLLGLWIAGAGIGCVLRDWRGRAQPAAELPQAPVPNGPKLPGGVVVEQGDSGGAAAEPG